MTDRHCLTLQNDIVEIARLVAWIEGLVVTLSLPRSTAHAMHLCVEEAVTNVISHALEPETAHDVRISVARDDLFVHAEIMDDGRPFDPVTYELPTVPEDLRTAPLGGLGIKLMRRFADGITYRRCNTLNWLRLSFCIPEPAPEMRRDRETTCREEACRDAER